MKRVTLPLLLLSSLALAQTPTTSVNGTWKIHSNVAGNEGDSTCTFVQKDSDLTGTCKTDQGESKLSGKVEGQKVSWSYNSDYNGTALTVKYVGTVAGDKMSGDESVDPFGVTGDFTATLSK